MNHLFRYDSPFPLECGVVLPCLEIAYSTYGTLNSERSNVAWICHALTANADPVTWWPGIVGEGNVIDPEEYFIVCANILASCYGSTGPLSINPDSGKAYYHTFPLITIRDMVRAHILLRKHLGINRIALLAGGSMGGYQALEWAVSEPEVIEHLFLLATSAAETAWGIAIHTAQRLAIEADGTWQMETPEAAAKGLKAARAIGMLTYRNYLTFVKQQTDPDSGKIENFKASAYIQYQGEKLVQRFNAFSYWQLTRSMDTHNLARERSDSPAEVLASLRQPALIIGISSDILCPVTEQQFLASHLLNARYAEIDSSYGHDGFLIESDKISLHLARWLRNLH